MRFWIRRLTTLVRQHQANAMAALIAVGGIAFLQLECPPRPAGADTIRHIKTVESPVLVVTLKSNPISNEENLTPEQVAERTLLEKIRLIEQGVAFLDQSPDYTAQFCKREVVGGELLDEQNTIMKVQHRPFCVYLKWMDFDVGREVIYGEGLNDNKLLVHCGGWKARLPALSLEPESPLAMQDSRYPVTQAGLLNLSKTIIEFNRIDLDKKNFLRCEQMEDQSIGERLCHCYVTEYRDAKVSEQYRKSITLIDKEWSIPLFVKNFGWPTDNVTAVNDELDEATLIEQYTFTDVKFRSSLTAFDFDHANEDYSFKRQ
jgi:hypothetical protein